MKKHKKKYFKVISNLIFICILVAILFFAKTYYDNYYTSEDYQITKKVMSEKTAVEDNVEYKEVEDKIEIPVFKEDDIDSLEDLIDGKDFFNDIIDEESEEYDEYDDLYISDLQLEEKNKLSNLNSTLKIVSTETEKILLPVINGKYIFYYNKRDNKNYLVNKKQIAVNNIFNDKLNSVTCLKLSEPSNKYIELSSDKININDEIYIYIPSENNEVLIKTNVISENLSFSNKRYNNLFRIKGYFDSDFLGAYVLDKNFDMIGVVVYYQQYKSNNLYFIGNDFISEYINLMQSDKELRFYDLNFKLISHINGLQVINSKNQLLQNNDIIISINGNNAIYPQEFYNLLYYALIKQEMNVAFLRNDEVVNKTFLPGSNLSFIEKELGFTLLHREEGFEIINPTPEGSRFLRQKGLNTGDVLISVNDVKFSHKFDFYLIKSEWNDSNFNKQLLFRTLRNTYVFFDY